MSRLRFSPKARQDLLDIGDYIALDSPDRALSFVTELAEHCERIAANPDAYPLTPDLGEGIRRAVHGRYLLFFTAIAGAVRIQRILHGAREIGDEALSS